MAARRSRHDPADELAGAIVAVARDATRRDLARREELLEAARTYAAASRSANTRRAYQADLRDFTGWCAINDRHAMPAAPDTVALYLTTLAQTGAKAATIQRRVSAISQAHQLAGHTPSPTANPVVRSTMAGIRRSLGTAPVQKAPLLTSELRRLLATCDPATRAGLRDRALLPLGFAGGFRRGELVGLDAGDVAETEDGLRRQHPAEQDRPRGPGP